MKVAAIDIGTNSVRLVLAEVREDFYQPLVKKTAITRLGKGISSQNRLSKTSVEKTLKVINRYLNLARKNRIELLVLAGTQALREAGDSQLFLRRVKEETGFNCLVIPAEKEGELMYKAVSRSFQLPSGAVVFDIGGGSTEFVYGENSEEVKVKKIMSLPIGSVRLTELYLHSDPPTREEIENLKKKVRKDLKSLEGFPRGILYGVAGTVTTIVAVANQLEPYSSEFVHGYYLKKEEAERVAFFLASLPLRARKKVKGLEPARADVIVGGAFLTLEIIDFFQAQGLVVSESDFLDGLALSWKDYGQPFS